MIDISSYFRALTGIFFLGVFFVEAGNSRLLACSIKEKETVWERFFGVFEILEHSFPSEHFQKSICNGGFSPVVDCRLQSCNLIKWEWQMFSMKFSKVFSAAISKYCHEIICDGVQQISGLFTLIETCLTQYFK